MNNIHYKCQLFVIAFLSAKNKNVTTPVDAEKVNKNYFLDIEPQNYEPQIISLSRQLPIMIRKNGIGNVMYFLSIKQKDIYDLFIDWFIANKLINGPQFEMKLLHEGSQSWYMETQDMAILLADYLKEILQERL